jgi:hypothetical protein
VIKGNNCCFATAICFDIIARDESRSERPREAIIKDGLPLDLLFVPECNPHPFHHAYARAVIDLLEDPQVAPQPPCVVFTNVAGGSSLPQLTTIPGFGFSRMVGRLGTINEGSNVVVHHDAVIAAEPLQELKQPRDPVERLTVVGSTCLICKPTESIFLVTLPRLGTGPSKDPTVKRQNTTVEVFRWTGSWQRSRSTMPIVVPKTAFGVPSGHVPKRGSSALNFPVRT